MMTRKHVLRSAALVMLAACGQMQAATPEPSADMMLILKHHRNGEHDLDAKGLKDDRLMREPLDNEMADFETYRVPYPGATADYFSYRVYLNRRNGKYWINITGGIAGVRRFLGPGLLADLKK